MSMLQPHVIRSRFFDLTSEEWAVLGLGSMAFVSFVTLLRNDVTGWPAAGLFFTALVFGHMCMTASRYVAFPDLVALASCLQLVVAPWLADAYPPNLAMFRNSLTATEYLPYALPATIALWFGMHIFPSRYLDASWWNPVLEPLSPRVRQALDGIIVLGLIADAYISVVPNSILFLVYLLASFRFFAALGWMVTETPGWSYRVALVFAVLIFQQATSGIFYLVVHWGGYFMLVYAFMRRWRWRLGALILIGVLGLGVLQQIKPAYREKIDLTWSAPFTSLTTFGTMFWDRLRGADQEGVQTDLGDTLVRFNQGWIVSKIMTWVPKDEPFAHGQTIADAVVFSVLPRFLFPDKVEGVSGDIFAKYTGVPLPKGTKMGLGLVGEAYANFSYIGGVLSIFLYSLALGAVFCFFAKKALLNPLWWAVGSIVMLPAVEPGVNFEDISNHVVKGGIILIILWKLMPAMQRLLSTEPPERADDEDPDGDREYAPGFHDGFADSQVPRRL